MTQNLQNLTEEILSAAIADAHWFGSTQMFFDGEAVRVSGADLWAERDRRDCLEFGECWEDIEGRTCPHGKAAEYGETPLLPNETAEVWPVTDENEEPTGQTVKVWDQSFRTRAGAAEWLGQFNTASQGLDFAAGNAALLLYVLRNHSVKFGPYMLEAEDGLGNEELQAIVFRIIK